MNMKEIKDIAAARGVKPGKMKKTEVIRAIQSEEGNPVCFETGKVTSCGEEKCLWREDCN